MALPQWSVRLDMKLSQPNIMGLKLSAYLRENMLVISTAILQSEKDKVLRYAQLNDPGRGLVKN